jgi:hypothetical protein
MRERKRERERGRESPGSVTRVLACFLLARVGKRGRERERVSERERGREICRKWLLNLVYYF